VCQELAKNLARELKELREAKGAKVRTAASRRGRHAACTAQQAC
jgi:hypothetical protein